MDQVPQWLLDRVAAAGMTTAYADDFENSNKNSVMEADSAVPTVIPDTIH